MRDHEVLRTMSHSKASDPQLSWVMAEGGLLLFAEARSAFNYPLESAVSRLICGISEEFAEERFRYLRKRIFTSGDLSLWDKNLIKVCAKRHSIVQDFATAQLTAKKIIDIGRDIQMDESAMRAVDMVGEPLSQLDAENLVLNLSRAEGARHLGHKRHEMPRNVAAAMVSGSGRLIAAAVNTNVRFQMRHAEVNLIVAMLRQSHFRIPPGTAIYTSLKPCRMCAALILDSFAKRSEDPSTLRVFSLEDDLGRFGRHNQLAHVLKIKSKSS